MRKLVKRRERRYCCGLGVGARLLGGYGVEAVTGFQAFAEAVDEPCGWRSVNDVVIEGNGQAQELPRTEFAVDQSWFGTDAADGELKSVVRGADGPTVAGTEHADRGDCDTAGEAFPPRRKPLGKPPDLAAQKARKTACKSDDSGLLAVRRVRFDASNFIVDRQNRPLVRTSNDVGDTDSFAVGFPFDEDVHIDVLEFVDSSSPITVPLDVRLFSNSGGQTGYDESGEREFRSGLFLDGPDALSGIGDVDLDESVNVTPVSRHLHVIHRQLLLWRYTRAVSANTVHSMS